MAEFWKNRKVVFVIMKVNRIMLAAPRSGSGKTMITCALLQALKNRGQQVVSYKCGPDYIDPMFHEHVIDIPSKNLDTFFTGSEDTKALFLKERKEEEFVILEGVMGLFDGLGGIREEGSSYHLAEVTKTPIVLVVDAKGMGRSVVAFIAGFLSFDKEKLIKGVILNKMSKSYYDIIRPIIEEELKILVFGYFPEQKELHLESRHLGLVMPGEIRKIKDQLQKAAEVLEKTVNLEKLMETSKEAEELERHDQKQESVVEHKGKEASEKTVIAVAKDEAFCFYYAENLSLLQEYGAEIKYFSPLYDKELPDNCHGLLIGGGYPELYAKELSLNESMHRAIRQAAENHMPIVAECGGFMYLHSSITDEEGNSYHMVGVLSASCHYTGKLVRFGYIELQEKQSSFLPEGEKIRGHEFHYYDSSDNGADCLARKPFTSREYDCVIERDNCWLGFPHLYYPANIEFARSFVQKAEQYRKMKKEN